MLCRSCDLWAGKGQLSPLPFAISKCGGNATVRKWVLCLISLHNTTAFSVCSGSSIYTHTGGNIWLSPPPPVKTVTISLLTTRRKLLGWARILNAAEVIRSHEKMHHMLWGCQLLMRMRKGLVPVCRAREWRSPCCSSRQVGALGCHFFSLENPLDGDRGSPRGDSRGRQDPLKSALHNIGPGQIAFL